MIKFEGLIFLASISFVLYTFIDCARREDYEIQKLPKWGWLLVIFFFQTIGAIAFFVLGRKQRAIGGPKKAKKRILPPDDDPDFLRSI